MKIAVKKTNAMLATLALSSAMLLPIASSQASILEANTMKRGVTFCGGNHNIRAGGTEKSFTIYTFRNYSPKPMTITSLRIYDANGTVIVNYPDTSAFPPGFKTSLGARQATVLNTDSILPYDPALARPLTMQVTWKYNHGRRGIPLFTGVVRHNNSVADKKRLASFTATANCFVRAK
jgi:hypothetical protein